MMNRILTLVCFVLLSAASMAQTGKVGYVNSDAVISMMPSFQTAQSQLESYAKTVVTPDIEQKQKTLEARYEKFQKESANMGDARREVEAKEIMKLEQELNQVLQQNQVQQKIAQKEQELLQPVQKEAQDLIASVAKANGFSVVLDTRAGIVWAEDGASLMPLLKSKLGIK